jgi:hypothetical protein
MKFQIDGSLVRENECLIMTTYLEYILSTQVTTYWWAQWTHPVGTCVYLTKADTLENN